MTMIRMQALGSPLRVVYGTYSGSVGPDSNGYCVIDVRDLPNFISAGFIPTSVVVYQTDPDATNDASQGYSVGFQWVNTIYPRVWLCISNIVGAASWILLYQQA